MAQKHRFNRRKQQKPFVSKSGAKAPPRAPVVYERKPPTQYGKPFVLLEDQALNTFEYASGAWVPYSLSIAECRHDYLVTELPQKVNGKTRYEIRCPLPAAE